MFKVSPYVMVYASFTPKAMMGIESNGLLLSAIHKEEGREKLNFLMADPYMPAGAKLY